MAFLVDTFTDTNGTNLESHTPDTGGAWSALDFGRAGGTPDNTLTIESNRLSPGATNSAEGSAWRRNAADPGGAEYDIELTVSNRAAQGNRFQSVAFRMSSTGTAHSSVDRYEAQFDNTTSQRVTLRKVVGGTITDLASGSIALASTAWLIKIEVRDASKTVFSWNGSSWDQVVTSADNEITQAGRVGLQGCRGGDAAQYIDGLTATAVSGGGSVSGSAAASFGGLSAAANGTRETAGSASASFGGLSAPASGVRETSGSAAGSFGGLSAAANGVREVIASATADLGGLTAHATGDGAGGVEGSASADFGGLTAAASGARGVSGSASVSFGGLTATGSGTRKVTGSAAALLGGLVGAGSGTVTRQGVAAALLGGLAATATGTREVVGSAAADFGGLTAHAVTVDRLIQIDADPAAPRWLITDATARLKADDADTRWHATTARGTP